MVLNLPLQKFETIRMNPNITYPRIWNIAYPIILGSVAQNLINVTDTAFLGRVGEVELGASALGGMFYLVIIMVGLGFGTGTQIIISRRFGEGKSTAIGKTFDHAVYFIMPLSMLAFAFMYWFSEPLLRVFIDSDQIYEASVSFVDFRKYGIFFAFGQILFRSLYIGIANTQVITWSTLFMAIVNIVLDYGLIFGELGLPKMGLRGAALASSIAEMSALFFLLGYVYYKKHHKQYKLFIFSGFDKPLFLRNLKLAYPIMFQNFLSLSVWFAFFLMVEKLGEQSLAVSNIIRSIYIVMMMPIWGFAAAANSMVSYLIGLKQQAYVFLLMRRIIILALSSVGLLVLIIFIAPTYLLQIYTPDPELIRLSIPVMKVVGISAFFIASGFIFFNGVMGTGRTNISLLIEVVTLSLYLLYIYLVINFLGGGVVMVWTSEIIYGVLLSALSWSYLKKGSWTKSMI